jgi:hypothetical protein
MRCCVLPAGACLVLAFALTVSTASAQEPAPIAAEAPSAPAPVQAPPAEPGAPSEPVVPAPAEPPPPEPAPPPPSPAPAVPPPDPAPPVAVPWPAEPATAPGAPAPVAPAPVAPAPFGARALSEPPKNAPPTDDGPVEPADDSHGVLGPFRIGPVLSFGLPSLLGFGGMLKLTRYFGAGVNVGLIPEMTFKYYGEAKVSYQEYTAYGHIHPFGGGFFLGAQVGYARVRGSYATTVDLRAYSAAYPGLPDRLAYTSRATVQTLVLTPEIGYFHIFGAGFSFGVDAGLQIPIAPSDISFERGAISGLPSQISDQALAPYDQKVRTTLEKVGRTILPAFHLRAGFLL